MGKSTTCENLGVGLAAEGKKVLLVDTDPQGSLTIVASLLWLVVCTACRFIFARHADIAISMGWQQPDELPTTLSTLMQKAMNDQPIQPDEGVLHHAEGVDLIPANIELAGMVDEKKISFNPAVELSYLDESQQRDFLEAMEDTQNAPSLSQAQQLKKMAQQGEFSYEKAFDMMGQEKKSEKDTVTIKNETLRKYFPRSYTPRQMEEKIIQLLDAWQRKQQRHNER